MLYRELIKGQLKKSPQDREGLGVRELARLIDVSPSHILVFRDTENKPNKATLDKLARYFHTPPEELLRETGLVEQIMAFVRRLPDEKQEQLLAWLQDGRL